MARNFYHTNNINANRHKSSSPKPKTQDLRQNWETIQMKVIQIILIIFCCALKSCVFGQTLPQKNIRDKEAIEIAYITECIKANRKIDNLIEWKLSSRNDSLILYEYKGRLAFFTLQKDKKGIFLHKINYFKSSFQKMIYINNNLIEPVVHLR
ncbi:hypothetical protein [Pedobacter sp. UBA4863]|uniref:hypothetical protein n=1 Tax=Pedobacter sp. UBA4863 TaxID=1947060 RepID=UPI0025CC469E|nr:hypothetical protein [Pedobacter sp. UBA4863]